TPLHKLFTYTTLFRSYDPNQKEKALTLLEEVKQENAEYTIINFYLAKAYAVNYNFDKAIELFNFYVNSAPADEAEQIRIANQMRSEEHTSELQSRENL